MLKLSIIAQHEENTCLPPLSQEWLHESSLADAFMLATPPKATTSRHQTKRQQERMSEEKEEEEEDEKQQEEEEKEQEEETMMEEDPEAFLHPPLDHQQLEQAAQKEAIVDKQHSTKVKLFLYYIKLTHYCPPFTVQEALAEKALNFTSLKSLKACAFLPASTFLDLWRMLGSWCLLFVTAW
ncbi:MLLT6, PHD finger containing [Balamuthia mandrillaris]